MNGFSLTRGQGLLLVALLWLAGMAAVFGLAVTRPDPVVVTHWGSGHVARPAPEEGSTAHYYPAGVVQAPWVTPEQVEAAQKWIDFLQEDAQQRAFMPGR